MDDRAPVRYVAELPDLVGWDEAERAGGRLLRLRLRVTDEGVEILGDSPCPDQLERLLQELGPGAIEKMLCG